MSDFRVYEHAQYLSTCTLEEMIEAFNQAVLLGDQKTADILDLLTDGTITFDKEETT